MAWNITRSLTRQTKNEFANPEASKVYLIIAAGTAAPVVVADVVNVVAVTVIIITFNYWTMR